jgi:hypothetical protein
MVQFSRADIVHEWPASESVELQFDPQAGLDAREFDHLKQAPDNLIRSVIQKVYDDQQARDEKPPNIKGLRKIVLPLVRAKGYEASGRRVEEIGSEPVFKKRRRTPGKTVKSERARKR